MEHREQEQQLQDAYFEQILQEAVTRFIFEQDKQSPLSLPPVSFDEKYKRRKNRIYRELLGSSFIPHPEVDNIWERYRSKFIIKISKIKKHFHR